MLEHPGLPCKFKNPSGKYVPCPVQRRKFDRFIRLCADGGFSGCSLGVTAGDEHVLPKVQPELLGCSISVQDPLFLTPVHCLGGHEECRREIFIERSVRLKWLLNSGVHVPSSLAQLSPSEESVREGAR